MGVYSRSQGSFRLMCILNFADHHYPCIKGIRYHHQGEDFHITATIDTHWSPHILIRSSRKFRVLSPLMTREAKSFFDREHLQHMLIVV